MKVKLLIAAFAFRFGCPVMAQESKSLQLSGYVEAYYSYDFGEPDQKPSFFYSYNRQNEVALNLALLKASYQTDRVRGNLGLMAGTYPNANLSAEPNTLKNIFEANVGVKLSNSHNIWVDAGIFPSHIGFESAIGKDCWNLTRSILADNSPYYESGAKVSYSTHDGKWFFSGLILNGWQRMQRVEGNKTIAFGHQITFRLASSVTLNSSSFIGNDKPSAEKKMRYFHNFYGQFQLHSAFGLIVGLDTGVEQKTKGSTAYHAWYCPILIAQYKATPKVALAARAEYYSDKEQVIISTNTANGFQTFGFSLNCDYQILDNVLWRIEYRNLQSKDAIFEKHDLFVTDSWFVTTALALSF